MSRWCVMLCILAGVALHSDSQVNRGKKEAPLRLMLSEVQPGTMSSEHTCLLVFDDHSFHAEKANRSAGRDQERKIYEGNLSDADWSALDGILENDGFRKLNVSRGYVPLAMQSVHPFTISVRRDKQFQDMEFMDDSSRKPYDEQLKPLWRWWKSMRSRRMAVSEAPADSRCTPDRSHAVVSY